MTETGIATLSRSGSPHGALADRAPARAQPGLEICYECASEAIEAGRIGEAAVGLVALLGAPDTRSDALLELAVCATRLDRFDDGLVLALASCQDALGHPRAYVVAGLCELQRGNRRTAQTYLAGASRIARRHAEYGEDLRMAQRLLLLMHMG